MDIYLLGQIDYKRCTALQSRLAHEASHDCHGRIRLLLCEHHPVITIGRGGSRAHLRLKQHQLSQRQLPVLWVNRGGGVLLHAPGQLAVYPITPLDDLGWSVGQFMRRLQSGLSSTLKERNVSITTYTDRFGVWGRTGQLAALGVAVRHGVTRDGAFLNVNPPIPWLRTVSSHGPYPRDPAGRFHMSCLLAEQGRPAKMALLRSLLIAQLAAAFDVEQYNLHTGHPHLREESASNREESHRFF